MTTTDGNGIIFLEETDLISPFHATINTLQSGTTTAISTVYTNMDSRLPAAPLSPMWGENNNPVELSTAPSETGALVTLSFSLPYASRLQVFAESHVEPGGNAAGQLRIKRNGTTVITRDWHSRSTSYQQWPSVSRWLDFAAGSHTLTITGSLSSGSSGTSYDHTFLSVGAR